MINATVDAYPDTSLRLGLRKRDNSWHLALEHDHSVVMEVVLPD